MLNPGREAEIAAELSLIRRRGGGRGGVGEHPGREAQSAGGEARAAAQSAVIPTIRAWRSVLWLLARQDLEPRPRSLGRTRPLARHLSRNLVPAVSRRQVRCAAW